MTVKYVSVPWSEFPDDLSSLSTNDMLKIIKRYAPDGCVRGELEIYAPADETYVTFKFEYEEDGNEQDE